MHFAALAKRFRKPAFQPGWLVFAQDEQGLRWLHVVQTAGEKPRVLAWGKQLPGEDLSQQVVAMSLRNRLKRCRCLAVANADEYQIVQTDLPIVPAEEMRQALHWSIQGMVDKAVEDIGVDYIEVPADSERGGISRAAYVVYAQRQALDRYVSAFSSAKARLHVVDIPETAHRNLAALCDTPGLGTALLGVMPDYSLLTFTLKGELCLARRIQVGLIALERGDAAQRLRLFEHILLEIQRSLDAFARQFHFAPLSRFLVSPLTEQVDLLPFLIDNLDTRVEPLDFSQYVDFSLVQDLMHPANLSACLSLLGAGLRSEDALEAN